MAGEGNLGRLGPGVNHFTALVVAAVGTCLVRQLLLMAIRAFAGMQPVKMIVRAACAGTALGMTSLWIRHYNSSWQAATQGG